MSASVNVNRCFVIMPFSETTKTHTENYWNNHFFNFLKPIIESCNVQAFRSVPLRQNILRQIVNDLVYSPIVVADLTDGNPNVFWELGVRQSFRHGTITIADTSFKIPFDISNKGILRYSTDQSGREEFTKILKEAISDCLANPMRPDSEVLETITGRTSVYATIHHEELIRKVDGLISEGLLNIQIMNTILSQAFENKGKKFASIRGKMVIITRLSFASIELLLAERYLEQDSKFYQSIHNLLATIHAVNHQLANWSTEGLTEKWLSANIPDIKKECEIYFRTVNKIREVLLTNC
jgi:hypothetical protein